MEIKLKKFFMLMPVLVLSHALFTAELGPDFARASVTRITPQDEIRIDVAESDMMGPVTRQVCEILSGHQVDIRRTIQDTGLQHTLKLYERRMGAHLNQMPLADLTAGIIKLAHAVHDSSKDQELSEQKQAVQARIDRCRAFCFDCTNTMIALGGLGLSIYLASAK